MATVAVVVGILYIRSLGEKPVIEVPPSPSPSAKVRTLGNAKFGPRSRPQSSSNIDVGIRTVAPAGSASPAPSARPAAAVAVPLADALIGIAQAQALPSPTPSPLGSPDPAARPGQDAPRRNDPSAPPSPAPATPKPLPTPPSFAPLAGPPAPQTRELVTVYAKGDTGKRQVFLRSLERDKDDQLVNSVFDDFGVSISTSTQKVAFYSNEEGPSDSARARSKLKVVDMVTGKVTEIAKGLPGAWPAAWSGDGKRLAIPTANSIFLADVTTGSSLQVPTGQNPGAISWAPGNLKIYFQAEAAAGNLDIYEADAITTQARPVVTGPKNERAPAASGDGGRLSFVRDEAEDRKGAAVVIRDLASSQDRVLDKSQPADSYLFNLELNDLVFVKNTGQPKLNRLKGQQLTEVGDLGSPVLVAWDRDYEHVFVLADDDNGKALFSVDLATGQAEKVKAGVSDSVPSNSR